VERAGGRRRHGTANSSHPQPTWRRAQDSYALFLLPGALAFLAVIVVPFLMNTGVSFTDWRGVGSPEWSGLANYRALMDDSEF
ncbi:sugar ABC transporter permease, partial [Streptomyces scabiei]